MLRAIRFIEDELPGILMAVMTVVMAAEVFARYVFGHSIIWASELATICFVWQVYLAASGAMRLRIHVRVDLLRNQLAGRLLAGLDTLAGLIIVGALALTAWQAWSFVTHTNFSALPATGLSRRTLALAVLVGCAGMLTHALLQLVQTARGLVTGIYEVHSADPLQIGGITLKKAETQ
ncbi:MAG: TRAP transporter small permease [Hoeflea sp.]|uniref:TRAP transporter small permease n=1 Tax=Hoeflea sp. TaxID=1940281 RepID=UPI00329817E3